MTTERHGARGTPRAIARASRLHAARRQHGAHAQRSAVGIGDEAGGVGEAEQLGEMQRRARALLAADQGEMILQAVASPRVNAPSAAAAAGAIASKMPSSASE